MAHHLSAKKRIRQNEKRRLHNRYYKVTARNAIKKFRSMTSSTEAMEAYPKMCSMLDRLATKRIIHKNKASNLKSKLRLFANKLAKAS